MHRFDFPTQIVMNSLCLHYLMRAQVNQSFALSLKNINKKIQFHSPTQIGGLLFLFIFVFIFNYNF